jgi:hypothetical protein
MRTAAGCFLFCLLAFASTGRAAIYNGSFESGDLSGWSLTIALANDVSYPPNPPPPQIPAGSASVLSSGPRSPIQGSYFLDLQAGGQRLPGAPYNPFPQIYDSYVSVSLPLNSGDTVSGWSFFSNGDLYAQDSAWARVFDNSDVQLSELWFEVSGDNPYAPGRINTPWTFWQWSAPSDGTYVLKLGVTTMGDGTFPSDGFFDDIEVTTVPEPQTATLLAMAGSWCVIKGFRKKNQR